MKITSNIQPSITPVQNKTKNGFGVPDFNPNKPLDFLDDKGNKILDKLLEGRSQEDKTTMKVILNMTFHYLPSLKDGNQLHYVSNISTDSDSVKNTMQKFYDNNKNGGGDTIGLNNIVKEFLSLYTKETTPKQTQSTEETKSKNLEQFYKQDVQQPAEKTRVVLEKKIPKHESRYETLWNKRYHLSPTEEAEFSHLSANRPLGFLSDEANKVLAKSLEGKSDEEKGQIKAIISLEFTTSIKMGDNGNILHGKRDFSKKNHDEVVSKIKQIIDNTFKDTIGTIDILKDFLSIYSKNQEEQKSQKVILEDLLKKQSV